MTQVNFNGEWFEAKTEYRVVWREFTGYKDGEQKEMTFYSDYSRNPKEDALAFAEETREATYDGKEVGDVEVFERHVLPWEKIDA
jgi:hypothetical protein